MHRSKFKDQVAFGGRQREFKPYKEGIQVPFGWIPKFWKKELYTELRRYLGPWFRDLSGQNECEIVKRDIKRGHFHMQTLMPPKYPVTEVVGFLKGKSAIQIARVYLRERKNFTGQHFLAQGFFFFTVGMNKKKIREYIGAQEKEDRRLDQMNLFQEGHHL